MAKRKATKKKATKNKVVKRKTTKRKAAKTKSPKRKVAKKKPVKQKTSSRKVARKKPAAHKTTVKVSKATVREPKDTRKVFTGWHAVQLPASFMLISLLGLLITIYWVFPQSLKFGMAFLIVFLVMFLAALVSMGKAPLNIVRR